MTMVEIHGWLRWIAAAGYGGLFVALVRSGACWRVGFFTAWVLAMGVYLGFWEPYNVPLLVGCQPLLLALRFCVAVEAFLLATERIGPIGRRWIVVVMAAVGWAGMQISSGYYGGDRALDWYLGIRQQSRVGLGLAGLVGMGMLWNSPTRIEAMVKRHGLTLVGLFVVDAAAGFVRGPAMGERMIAVRCGFWVVSILCIGSWLRWGAACRFKPRKTILHLAAEPHH